MATSAQPANSVREIASMPQVQEFLSMLKNLQTGNDGNPYYKSQGKRRLPKKLDEVNGETWPEDAKYGAYQLTGQQWRSARADLGLDGFTQENQDIAAVNMLVDSGAVEALAQDDIGQAIGMAAEVFPKLRTSPKKVAKLLGVELPEDELIAPPAQPELPDGAVSIGGEMVVAESDADRSMQDKIMSSGQNPEIQRRMLGIHNAMPSTTTADERLIGDGLPKEFDNELRAMLAKY